MAEVYAGFSEYTDAQVGRIVDYLEESGQLDNTIIFYCADNGASGEGSPNGSVNEGKFFNGWPDTIEDNLPMIDKLGRPDTYNHYPTGWAVAFSTPYRMFKRYTYQGGVCDPLVIHWPTGSRRAARCATSTTTRLTSCRRSWSAAASDARGTQRCQAVALVGRVDALQLRRRRRADAEGDAVLRDVRAPRHLAQGLEGRDRARPDERHGQLRAGPLAALPYRRGPLRGARPGRAAAREGQAARRRSGWRRPRRTTSCR